MNLPSDVANCMVRWLTLGDLEVFQTASLCTKIVRDREIWLRLRRFVFSGREAISRQSSWGRTLRRTASTETNIQALYLSSLFKYYMKVFVELDLQTLNAQVLEKPCVMSAISKLPYLAYLILPRAGWSCTSARKQFLSVLRDSVSFEFCGKGFYDRPH